MIDNAAKLALVQQYQQHGTDTGSSEVQCAILTHRILDLTKHLEANHKDFSSKRGLLKLVGQRKKLLAYLKEQDQERYRRLIGQLGLRK